MPDWQASALRVASCPMRKADLYYNFHRYREPDAIVDLTFFLWVLQRADATVVVDTGFAADWFRRRGGEIGWDVAPAAALAAVGVDAATVETVVLTHLHFDHIGGIAQFPAARFIVQKREWEFWHGPLGRSAPMCAHVDKAALELLDDAMAHGRVLLVDDGAEVVPGVRLLLLPGHTPGQQGVLVDDRLVLAGDAVHFYEELDRRMLYGTFTDACAMYGSYERLTDLRERGYLIVPGHEPEVLGRFAPVDADRPGLGACLDRPLITPT